MNRGTPKPMVQQEINRVALQIEQDGRKMLKQVNRFNPSQITITVKWHVLGTGLFETTKQKGPQT